MVAVENGLEAIVAEGVRADMRSGGDNDVSEWHTGVRERIEEFPHPFGHVSRCRHG